ncbi:MAG: LysR family transcriptional regulator [Myxococcota bacterium]
MDLASVDLNLLVSLDLLLDERSVRGAARRAHVSPSAMSHTLARLRDLLGDEVLVRAGRGMVPTPRAEALSEPLQTVLAGARGLLSDEAGFDPSTLERRFAVVCTDHVSTVLLGPAARRIAEAAPRVDMVVSPLVPSTMEDLRRGEVDLAIGVFPEAPPEVRARRLFEDRFVTVHRAGHPRIGSSLSLRTFLAESHALVAPRGTAAGLVDRVLAEQGITRRIAWAFPTFFGALWHVASSDAILTVSARLVAAVAERLPLVVHEPPVALPTYPLVLAWHPRTDRSPEDGWLRELLVRTARGLPSV